MNHAPVAQWTERRTSNPTFKVKKVLDVDGRLPTPVDWALAPEWVTPEQAAFLMGRHYSVEDIYELMDLGAFDLKDAPDGTYLIERDSLLEYQEALQFVLSL